MDRTKIGDSQSRPEIEADFPSLRDTSYQMTSERDPGYNCLAWSLGDTKFFWQPLPPTRGYYWPPGIPREDTVDAWAKVFELHGYERTTSDALEAGFEKVAIYEASDGLAGHAALQLASGAWTSKLGVGHDIEHPNPQCLEGDLYGRIVRILKRRRPL